MCVIFRGPAAQQLAPLVPLSFSLPFHLCNYQISPHLGEKPSQKLTLFLLPDKTHISLVKKEEELTSLGGETRITTTTKDDGEFEMREDVEAVVVL